MSEQNGTRKPRFRLVPFGQLRPSKAPAYLINGLIPRVGLTVVWGSPKSGKSFVISDLMMSVALGWEFRGRKVIQGPAVYCAFEGADGFGKRAAAFRQHYGLSDDLNVPFYLVSARMDFIRDHAELLAAIRLALGKIKPVAVVLDTLNRSLAGSESNDEDMARYVKAVDAVREELNCAVIVVHHCGVDTSRPRGHSSLTGAVDAQLVVKHDRANNTVIKVEWMKDGPEGDTLLSRLQVVTVGVDDDGDPITSCVVVPINAEAAQRDTLTSTPGRLPKAAQIALSALKMALEQVGEAASDATNIPAQTRTVTKTQWRHFAYRCGISGSTEGRAQQQAFQRAVKHLTAIGIVSLANEQVWLTGGRVHTRATSQMARG
jgi:AAA domain